jgi:hypothetical protein
VVADLISNRRGGEALHHGLSRRIRFSHQQSNLFAERGANTPLVLKISGNADQRRYDEIKGLISSQIHEKIFQNEQYAASQCFVARDPDTRY